MENETGGTSPTPASQRRGGVFGAARRLLSGRGDQAEVDESPPPPPPPPQAIWTDSHCHLQDDPDPAATLAVAREARVGRVVCVGTDAESSQRAVILAVALSGRRPVATAPAPDAPVPVPHRTTAAAPAGPGAAASAFAGAADQGGAGSAGGGTASWRAAIWATVGLHPHDAREGVQGVAALLEELDGGEGLAASRVVAVGECGLDYHYDQSPRNAQRRAFAAQIALAKQYDLALVIHTRDAWDDTFSILEIEGMPDRTLFHCFSGGVDEARRCLEMGAYLSFSGIVTFGNADSLREAAAFCPLDRLLVETDAPLLTPVPYRGKANQPAYVAIVGAAVAASKTLEPAVVAEASWQNAESLFRLGD